MSKKKRSKILATLLCATTMAAFYASPQIGYAVSLNQKEDGTVTTDSGGTNTAIHNIEGIESITFGVQGDMETGGVNLYFDGTGTYGGLVANGSLTATDLYITVENNADGDNYNSNRYSLKNALGIHRTGTGDEAITNIEANSQGHGGMQVSSDTVSILDGAAVFTNKTTSDNGGTISFSSAFNSEQGMTVGTNFVLDSTGKISKVNGIDVQGALTTTGTINSMTIGNNQVNGVTLNNGNVTANEVTVGSYKLSEVGSLANTINQKTMGIASYNASNGTTFNGKITAYAGVVTNSISDGSVIFRVSDAKDVIDAVNDSGTGLEATNDLAKKNESDIVSLGTKVDTFDGRITGNTNNITALGQRVTTTEGEIDTLQTTVGEHDTAIGSLDTRVDTAETDITALEIKTHNISTDGNSITNLTNLSTANLTATTGTIGSVTFTGGTATDLTNIAGDSVTVAGTAISNGSFNSVSISNFTSGTGATINGISIYKDSDGHYNVGTIDLNDLTGSGSSGTVDGIARTDNTLQDKEDNDYTTTIEGNLEVRTNGTITQRNGDFAVAADGTVTGKDFAVKGTGTTLSGVASNVTALQTTVGNQSSGLVKNVNDLNTTVSGHTTSISDLSGRVGTAETNIGRLQTTVGDESSGLVKNVNDLNTTVSGHTTSINALNIKTKNLSADGMQLTDMYNIESAKGTIGDISFDGKAITNVTSIGADTDTINIAGTPISKGSFNGVSISNYNSSGSTGATINGISIYKDTNSDYIVGDVNISDLQGVSGNEIKGIKRTSNIGGGFTTTIEENLAVSTDGTIKQTNGDFGVDKAGAVTGKDFVIKGVTSLSTVAQATTGMTYTAGNTTAEGVTSFDHNVHATNFTTDSADLNKLSATVGDANSGLVEKVNALNNKTTNLSADGSTLTDMTKIESAAGTIGGMTFATVNGMKTIGSADDTITVAGAEITSNSFNNVEIYQKDENSHYFVGDVDVSALKSGSTEITNKLRGITYSSDDETNYAMTLAGHFSVSTSGEFTFKDGTGKEYHLDDLINTVDTGDLEDFKELKDKVKDLEDKTTGISFDKESGSTTISDMTGTDTDGDGINDSFTKGDNSLTVGDDGITANGDTVINGDTDDNTTGGNGNGSNDPQGGDSIINGDQLVDGDQHVTGDSQFDGTVTVGTGTDGNGQTVINGGTINTGNTVIDGGQVKADEGHFDNITVGEGDNKTTIGDDGIKVGDNTTIDNSGVSIKDENGNVFMGDHDVVIKDSDGNVEASLSDVANSVDGIEQSIGDLNSRMGELEDRIDKVGAMAAAIANLRTMGYDPAAPTEVAVGIGQYRNETGAALGLFHYPNRDFMLSLSVSTSGDEVMGGIGATWKFGRKSPEKVAAEKAEKAREAKLQKAEAIKEAARLKKIEAQQERHAKLAAQKTATK